jgi:nicotinamidase-related amidase
VKDPSIVDPATTVLITQECQRGIIGDLAAPLLREAADESGMVGQIGRLVNAARDAGCHVLHCVAELRPDHPALAFNAPIMRMMRRHADPAPYDPAVMDIVDGIVTAATDLVSVRTTNVSPIIGTEVPTILRNLGTKTVVAVGVSTNLGIPQLAFDCVNLGLNVVIPRDAIVGVPADYGDVILKNTLSMVATITTTDELLDVWTPTGS